MSKKNFINKETGKYTFQHDEILKSSVICFHIIYFRFIQESGREKFYQFFLHLSQQRKSRIIQNLLQPKP